MNEALWIACRILFAGVGATLGMDAWGMLLRRFGIPSLDLGLLGRWVAGTVRGRFLHRDGIAQAPAVRAERALGWAAHYGIGVTFAALLVACSGPGWLSAPAVGPALAVGGVTVLAPWLILQPGLGQGAFARRTARPVFNSLKSLATHLIFGLGLYLWALLAEALTVAGPSPYFH